MPVDRSSRVPPHRQIADALRQRILSGDIPPGARIPSMTELEEEWEVARETIRKATKALKDEGLVETVLGMGLYVVEDSEEPADE